MDRSKNIRESYKIADYKLRVQYSKIGCILTIILVPIGISLDYFVYPEFLYYFMSVRVVYSLIALLILYAHFIDSINKYIEVLTLSYVSIVQIAISFMIFVTDGVDSTYYVGLILVILAVGVLLPLFLGEVLFFCSFTLGIYLIACLSNDFGPINNSTLFNNMYFIVLTGIISSTAVYFNARRRFEEFRLNYELDERNEALEEALKQLKEAESQLVQSEKLRGLGHMAAGLLHEINNPVNYTIMALQLLQREQIIQDDPDLKETFDDISDGINRIQEIISDLRNFATPEQIDQQKPFAFSSALDRALQFTGHDKEGIKIRRDICVEDMVKGTQSHIIQVLVNLLENAARAVLSVKETRAPEISITATSEDGRLYVKVSDNGTGIAEDDLPHIFNPFYTTQDVGEGMGLGLSICHTIVENHGGELRVFSEPGRGADFTFDLSLIDPVVHNATVTTEAKEPHHA